jgi:hypothetical protein
MLPVVKMTTSDKSTGYPPIVGCLTRCIEQELHIFKRCSLRTENIGMQKPMSENRTLPSSSRVVQDLRVTIGYLQIIPGAFSDAVKLHLTISQAQKEKDSTANATLWDHAYLRHELNQLVICSDNFGSVNQGNNIDEINHQVCYRLNQESNSIPRDCNSLRITLFIHADIDSSPSIFIASLIACSNCDSTLNAICLLPLGKFVFDICKTQGVCCLCLTVYNTFVADVKQQSPEVQQTLSRLLTNNIIGANAMATPQLNQTRLKFTFLIASGTQRLVDIHPVRLITVLADSENEARLLAGMSSLIFVSRQEVRHV